MDHGAIGLLQNRVRTIPPHLHLPMSAPSPYAPPSARILALAAMAVGLLALLALHLLLALLSGLTAFALHRFILQDLKRRVPARQAQRLAMLLVLLAFGIGLTVLVEGVAELSAASASGGLPRMMQLVIDTLDKLRASSPDWLATRLPTSALALHDAVSNWLHAHMAELQLWGNHTLRGLAYVLAGFVIGFLVAIDETPAPAKTAFAQAWRDSLLALVRAFASVAAAQLRIAAVNTLFTAIYLLLALPLLGHPIPLASTLVVITFLASLLPIVGNLVSNTAIVLVSLTVSPWLGLVSLGFLVTVHKLEYFLNAHIVGGRIHVKTYELLAAMLVMDAVFGLAGLVAAPIYYAWLSQQWRTDATA